MRVERTAWIADAHRAADALRPTIIASAVDSSNAAQPVVAPRPALSSREFVPPTHPPPSGDPLVRGTADVASQPMHIGAIASLELEHFGKRVRHPYPACDIRRCNTSS